jgi:RNA polymerase primary sigma factor
VKFNHAKSSVVSDVAQSNKRKTKHLTREEELRLVYLINDGAKLNVIKAEFEAEHKKEITREQWAERANMSKPDLRRLVSEYRDAKATLVMSNMGLVHSVVKKLYRTTKDGSADLDKEKDLIQEGSLGLIRAAELFDPSKGVRFSTYATIWIKGVLSHTHNHQTITVPSREKTKWSKISKAIKNYENEYNDRKITIEELSQKCGMTVEQVQLTLEKMPKAQNILSLDVQYNTHSRSGSSQASSNGVGLYGDKAFEDTTDLAENIQMKTDVVAALARNLDSREARLMRLRYGIKDGQVRTITECAEAMGISKQRASQLAKGCLKKLREADDAQSLQEYLLTVA